MGKLYQFNNRENRRKAKRETEKALNDLRKINKEVPSMADVDMSELKLPMIVVFNRPLDYPVGIMARLFDVNHPTNIVVRYESM